MSNRQRKNVSRSAYGRGPSRPIDPRRGPGAARYRRRGLDPFALSLIIVVGIGAVVVLLIFLIQGANNSSAGSAAAQQPAGGSTVPPDLTQTMVAFSTVTAPSVIPRITVQDAKALYDSGSVKIIDVRLKSLYDQGHIKGAVNIPQGEVGTRYKEVPKTGNVILYCDCPHDEESAGTAYTLRGGGYTNLKVLQGPQAYSEWKNAGYPVETSAP
jgi:rhodanese-related sulfurtransferase